MIKREYYLKRLAGNMWNGEIKIITGIRRCGKSVLLFDLFYEYLLSTGVADSQSALQMDTEQKENTQLLSLKLTGDFFRKIVIRMDIPHQYYDENGFYHCNLIDFLLGNAELL